MTPSTTYCTILSTNYLAKALSLAESLREHHEGAELVVLFIDHAEDATLPDVPGIRALSTASLGLDRRRILDLVMGYDLVEFATAVKPLLLRDLLTETEQVFYLDPDTWVLSPMVELAGELSASDGGILLTPHYLYPTPPERDHNEGHLLVVGVHNLGFCGVDRRALAFLDWWWDHLATECLYDPLSGLFVDQKWMDIGSTLFQARTLRHPGYNVGVSNLPERPLALRDGTYVDDVTGLPVRLFHFHAFDPSSPDHLTRRVAYTPEAMGDHEAVLRLCRDYAAAVNRHAGTFEASAYPYEHDRRGRTISRQLRRAHRLDPASADLPSPFVEADAEAYEEWRRGAWRTVGRAILGDVAKGVRIILPEEYDRAKARFPGLVSRVKGRVSSGVGMWR